MTSQRKDRAAPTGGTRRSFLRRAAAAALAAGPAAKALFSPAMAAARTQCSSVWCQVTDSFCSNHTFYHWHDCFDLYNGAYCYSYLVAVRCC
jgi:hypothetical protein